MIPPVCFLVVSCLCAFTQSFPLPDSPDAVLIDYKTDSHSRFEEGQPGKAVRGSYSWVNDDKIYQVDYTADESGYKPRLTIKSAPKSDLKTIVQPAQQTVADVQSAKEVSADAIVPVEADASVQVISKPEADKVTVTHQVVANVASEPVQEDNKAELVSETDESKPNKMVVTNDVKIPVVPEPIVQEVNSQDKPVSEVDEVKPEEFIVAQEIVVNVPVESDAVKDNNQSQPLDVQTEVKPDQLVAEEDIVANIPDESIPVESIPDVEESAQFDINQDIPLSQNDAQEMAMEIDPSMIVPSMFDPPSGENQSQDEIYTDDAVIIDAAIDRLSLTSGVLDNIDQWDQVQSQDEASVYLNAMLMDYANQMYGHAKPQAETEEIRQPEVRDEIEIQPQPFYYEVESDTDESPLDYQRTSVDNSNDDAYSISFDKLYNSFLHHLEVAKEYRARSKVDDDMQDQQDASQDLQSAFRLLVDVAETFTQDLPIPEKEMAQIEPRSGSIDYAPEDSILEELYYQQWLASQEQPIYYVVYPKVDDYYR